MLRSIHPKVPAVPDHMFEKALRILTKPKIVENSSGYHLSRGLDDNPLTSSEYNDFSMMCKYSGIFRFLKNPSNKVWKAMFPLQTDDPTLV